MGVETQGGHIADPWIKDITFGPTILAARGTQTDGLNIMGGDGLKVTNARVWGVDEGLDRFAKNGLYLNWHARTNRCTPRLEIRPRRGGKHCAGRQGE